jgi:hypothetical protein
LGVDVIIYMSETAVTIGSYADFFGQNVLVTAISEDGTANVRYCEPSGRTTTFATTCDVADLVTTR